MLRLRRYGYVASNDHMKGKEAVGKTSRLWVLRSFSTNLYVRATSNGRDWDWGPKERALTFKDVQSANIAKKRLGLELVAVVDNFDGV